MKHLIISFILCFIYVDGSSQILPSTPTPEKDTVSHVSNRVCPNKDSLNMSPRWMPWTLVDWVQELDTATQSPVNIDSYIEEARMCEDSRNVQHFIGISPDGSVWTYSSAYKTRGANGLSERIPLWTAASPPMTPIEDGVDICVDSDDNVHYTWIVEESQGARSVYYAKKLGSGAITTPINVVGPVIDSTLCDTIFVITKKKLYGHLDITATDSGTVIIGASLHVQNFVIDPYICIGFPALDTSGIRLIEVDSGIPSETVVFEETGFGISQKNTKPKLAMSSGVKLVAWERDNNIKAALDTSGWVPFDLGATSDDRDPDLSVDPTNGNFHYIYLEITDPNTTPPEANIRTGHFANGIFSPLETVSTRPGSSPQIAIDRTGFPHVAWIDSSGVMVYAEKIDTNWYLQLPAIIPNETLFGDDWTLSDFCVTKFDQVHVLGQSNSGNLVAYAHTTYHHITGNGTAITVGPNASVNPSNGNLNCVFGIFGSAGAGYSTSIYLSHNSRDNRPPIMSPGWTHNYHSYLTVTKTAFEDQAFAGPGTPDDIIVLHDGDANSVLYRYTSEFNAFIADTEFGEYSMIERDSANFNTPYTLTTKHGILYRFRLDGKMKEVEDRNGNKLILDYTAGLLDSIEDSMGRITNLQYDTLCKLIGLTDPAGKQYTLLYNDQGQLEEIEYTSAPPPDLVAWKIHYYDTFELIPFPGASDAYAKPCLIERVYTPRGRNNNYYDEYYYLPDGSWHISRCPPAQYMEEDGAIVQNRAVTSGYYLNDSVQGDQTFICRSPRLYDSAMLLERRRNLCKAVTDEEGYSDTMAFDVYSNLVSLKDARGFEYSFSFYPPDSNNHVADNMYMITLPEGKDTMTATSYVALTCTYTEDGYNNLESFEDCKGTKTQNVYDPINGNLLEVLLDTITLACGDIEMLNQVFEYNSMGEPTLFVNESNDTTVWLNFDTNTGLALEVSWPETAENEVIALDEMGNCISVTEPGGGTTIYSLDGLYRLDTVFMPVTSIGQQEIYLVYDEDSDLEKIYDNVFGVLCPDISFTYDDIKREVMVTDAVDNTSKTWYDLNDNVVQVQDFRGNKSRAFYYADDVIRESAVSGTGLGSPIVHRRHFTFDCNNNLILETLKANLAEDDQITSYQFDAQNRLYQVIHPEDDIIELASYDCASVLTEEIIGNDLGGGTYTVVNQTNYMPDEYYRIKSATAKVGLPGTAELTVMFNCFEGGDSIVTKDPMERQWSEIMDGRGNYVRNRKHDNGLIGESFPNDRDLPIQASYLDPVTNVGQQIAGYITWNDRNQVDSVTDVCGNTATYEYDNRRRLIKSTDPAGYCDSIVYNKLDQPIETISAIGTPDESRTYISYDAHDNVTMICKYNPASTEYDACHQKIYDDAGRLIKMCFPGVPGLIGDNLCMTWEYDALGNMVKFTDRNGKIITYGYDKLNRPRTETHFNPNDSTHNVYLEYDFDAAGNLTREAEYLGQDNTGTETFEAFYTYDCINRMSDSKWYLYGDTLPYQWLNFEYDSSSNLVKFCDLDTICYGFKYDENNWNVGISGPEGMNATIGYDNGGRKTDIWLGVTTAGDSTDAISHCAIKYDKLERPQEILTSTNLSGSSARPVVSVDTTMHLRFNYDPRWNRNKIFYDHLRALAEFTYDGQNRLSSETWQMSDTSCTELSLDIPVGMEASMEDIFPAVTAEGIADACKQYIGTYLFDPVNNRTRKVINGAVTDYQYDTQNRLISAQAPDTLPAYYSYDASGNVLSITQGMFKEYFGYDYLYRTSTYQKEISDNLVSDFKYVFSPDGQRLAKQDLLSGKSEWFRYFGEDVYADHSQDSSAIGLTLEGLYLNGLNIDSKLAHFVADSSASYWYLTDALGTAHLIHDSLGNIVNRHLTDAWGVTMPTDFTEQLYKIMDRHRGLALREIDDESELQYTRARLYDPELGRFLAQDRILGNMIDEHYQYAGGNPVMGRDPLGLFTMSDKELAAQKKMYRGMRVERLKYYEQAFLSIQKKRPHTVDPRNLKLIRAELKRKLRIRDGLPYLLSQRDIRAKRLMNFTLEKEKIYTLFSRPYSEPCYNRRMLRKLWAKSGGYKYVVWDNAAVTEWYLQLGWRFAAPNDPDSGTFSFSARSPAEFLDKIIKHQAKHGNPGIRNITTWGHGLHGKVYFGDEYIDEKSFTGPLNKKWKKIRLLLNHDALVYHVNCFVANHRVGKRYMTTLRNFLHVSVSAHCGWTGPLNRPHRVFLGIGGSADWPDTKGSNTYMKWLVWVADSD